MSDDRAEQAITAKAEEVAAVSAHSVEEVKAALWSVFNAMASADGEAERES